MTHCWPSVTCRWDERDKMRRLKYVILKTISRCILLCFSFFFLLNQKAVRPSARGDATSKDKAGVTWRLALSEWCLSSSSHRLISRASSHNRHKGQRCCVGGCVSCALTMFFLPIKSRHGGKRNLTRVSEGKWWIFFFFFFSPSPQCLCYYCHVCRGPNGRLLSHIIIIVDPLLMAQRKDWNGRKI